MAKNGRGQSGHLTLELTVSQERVDIMNGYFACWCKFRKVKTYFKKFLRGRGYLVRETLKSAVIQRMS